MPRVLARPEVDVVARPVAGAQLVLDPVAQQAVARAAADGFERGRAEGRAEAAADAARVLAGLRVPVETLLGEIAATRAAGVQADVELALAIAEVVVGTLPPPPAHELAARVAAAVEQLDDAGLTLHLHPDDHDAVVSVLPAVTDPTVSLTATPDPTVAPGEAHLRGRWARAELTRQAAMAAVREALAEATGADAPSREAGDA